MTKSVLCSGANKESNDLLLRLLQSQSYSRSNNSGIYYLVWAVMQQFHIKTHLYTQAASF